MNLTSKECNLYHVIFLAHMFATSNCVKHDMSYMRLSDNVIANIVLKSDKEISYILAK